MTKIEAARQEYYEWCQAIGIETTAALNEALNAGRGIELINLCEARQERKYAALASKIYLRRQSARIVMLAGPSSSGKTSSSLRIALQLKALGLNPKVIELDNYFINRDQTPLDENGEYDFECLGAMDVKFLNEQLNALIAGEEIEVPTYDFKQGKRVFNGKTLRLNDNDILLMEGIHALNPDLTPGVDQSRIFKVYVSALNTLFINETLRHSPSDKRLLRRIVRDFRTRGMSPEASILRWPSVRRGEKKNIFPYEENADVVFTSSMLYDLPLLKYYAEPLLYGIAESSPAYAEAQRILDTLKDIVALKPAEIAAVPPTSIMREFIGGQTL